MRMKLKVFIVYLLFALAASLVHAQAGPPRGDDPFGQSFFAPELVFQNQEALSLTDEQKDYFKAEMRQAQLKFTDMQFKLQDEMEKLQMIVRSARVDEQQTLAQLEKVLSMEREIKRTQIGLLVRIKNKLTPEQQAKLQDVRSRQPGR
jgi:Spy/CpxP family protein refolding chaperone